MGHGPWPSAQTTEHRTLVHPLLRRCCLPWEQLLLGLRRRREVGLAVTQPLRPGS